MPSSLFLTGICFVLVYFAIGVNGWKLPKSLHAATAEIVRRSSQEFINRHCNSNSIENIQFEDNYLKFIAPHLGKNADFQTNVAQIIAKRLKLNANDIAKQLVVDIKALEDPLIKDIDASGNGYINFTLSDGAIWSVVENVLHDPNCGLPGVGFESGYHQERIVVDYFSPNVGKPLHIGNFRSLILGNCISNAYQALGARVFRRNHVGDWGSQSGLMVRYLLEYDPLTFKILDEEHTDKESLRDHEIFRATQYSELQLMYKESEDMLHLPQPQHVPMIYISSLGEIYSRASKLKASDKDFVDRVGRETARLQLGLFPEKKAWSNIKLISKGHFNDVVKLLDFKHLKTVPESAYSKRVFELYNKLVEAGLCEVNEDGSGHIGNMFFKTKHGAYTYSAVEAACLIYRSFKFNPTKIIYVTDKSQERHFTRIFDFVKKNKLIPDNISLQHTKFEHVKSPDNTKMSSRSGSAKPLLDVLRGAIKVAEDKILSKNKLNLTIDTTSAKIGIGSVIYSDLHVTRDLGYVFSMDRVVSQGFHPLVCVLYVYVRARSIFESVKEIDEKLAKEYEFVPPTILDRAMPRVSPPIYTLPESKVIDDRHRNLALCISYFPLKVEHAAAEAMPNRLCQYFAYLVRTFNSFYHSVRVIDKENNTIDIDAFKLVCATRKIIHMGLQILGVQTVNIL